MSILRHLQRLRFIDYLVQKRRTGNLESFAKKNKLSKSGLSIVLNEMKQMGFPIKYDRQINSYYYEEDGDMIQCLFIRKDQVLSAEEITKLTGGDMNKNLCYSKYKIFEVCANE